MRGPFVMRVQNDDPHIARSIARALVPMLRERGARVLVDGQPHGGGSAFAVHLITGGRGLPGTTVSIGVQDEEHGPRWLAPLDLPDEPGAASSAAIRFLEEWGFVPAARSASRAAV